MNAFNNIYGQDLAISILESAIAKEHIATAYLFSGPEGVGRKKTAKVFIKAILEKNKHQESTSRKIENNNHPDLLWIEPTYIVQGKIISQSKARSENISIKSPPQIRLNQIKEIINFLGTNPFESERSIVIIEDIERINESASNALLKTLEETNKGLFILITNRPEKLLSTIRSRCEIVPFIRLKDNEVKNIINKSKFIQDTDEINEEIIEDLIDFSYGSPGRYMINLKYWLSISGPIREKLDMELNNKIELLKLAKEITDELNMEQQLWIIDFKQYKSWVKKQDSNIVRRLELLRRHLLKFVQPRLAWELTLLEINLIG